MEQLMRFLILAVAVSLAAYPPANGQEVEGATTAGIGERLILPEGFYKEGDAYYLETDQSWYSMFIGAQSGSETWEAFTRGWAQATGQELLSPDQVDIASMSLNLAAALLNGFRQEIYAQGYESQVFTQAPSSMFPKDEAFRDRCSYYGYETKGITSREFPETVFITRAHHLVCVIFDPARKMFHFDIIELSERHAPEKNARPIQDLAAFAASIFSTLIPPAEFGSRGPE